MSRTRLRLVLAASAALVITGAGASPALAAGSCPGPVHTCGIEPSEIHLDGDCIAITNGGATLVGYGNGCP